MESLFLLKSNPSNLKSQKYYMAFNEKQTLPHSLRVAFPQHNHFHL